MSVWFVTGASRGFGSEIVRAALSRGHQVVATARDSSRIHDRIYDRIHDRFPGADDRLLPVDLDIVDEAQSHAAVARAVQTFGRIDVLVNNAGRGLLSAVEEASDAAARAVFDTNVFGTLNVQRAVLPVLRRQKSGHVINISSVGGFAGSPGWGIYSATKFAMEGFSEAMSAELEPLGIKVTIVEPGYFRTDFLDASSLHTETAQISDYSASSGAMRHNAVMVNHVQRGDPVKAAAAIVDIAESPRAPLRLQLGADCVERVEEKLATVRRELDTWRAVSVSTDHPDVGADVTRG
ncbi:short-chain dehydrogenase/reductase [Planotetraspora silvatica]|uniref:Short-chain dehydrogenase/reductase n=1 Tax=Planotetraspora silvatica TaxID=234614 RepID=A0A8J3URF7_9ACTN|nr:oxidoreductase [Planotetraspora silvatica]GII49922.1 short-chain dehydrogenase/reductase [Planotetraspora silvatica]